MTTTHPLESALQTNERPLLVDFHADWCGPCQTVAPVVAEISETYQGQIDVVKVDVDERPDLARRYNVRSIPTFIMFRDGQPADTRVGAVRKADLVEIIEAQTS